MSGRLVVALCAFALVLTPGVASAAPILIDSFFTPNPGAIHTNNPVSLPLRVDSGFEILGTRTTSVTAVANGLDNDVQIGGGPGGFYDVSSGVSDSITTQLAYNFGGSLSGATQIDIEFDGVQGGLGSGNALSITAVLETVNGDRVFSTTVPDSGALNNVLSLGFGSFSNAGFGDTITGFRLSTNVGGFNASDFRIDNISTPDGTFDQGDPVPEPASLALFGLLGLGGVAAARRKMKKIAG
jgi:hypothetical protein